MKKIINKEPKELTYILTLTQNEAKDLVSILDGYNKAFGLQVAEKCLNISNKIKKNG